MTDYERMIKELRLHIVKKDIEEFVKEIGRQREALAFTRYAAGLNDNAAVAAVFITAKLESGIQPIEKQLQKAVAEKVRIEKALGILKTENYRYIPFPRMTRMQVITEDALADLAKKYPDLSPEELAETADFKALDDGLLGG